MTRNYTYLLALLSTLLFASCNQTKYVPESDHLLTENHILIDSKNDSTLNLNILSDQGVSEDDLLPVIKQKPNRKIFLLGKFHLWLYNKSNYERIIKNRDKKIAKVHKKNDKITRKNNRKTAKDPNYKPKPLLDPIKDRKNTFGEGLRSAGEGPVILDSMKVKKSSKQLSVFLINKGYFHNIVRDSIVYLDDTITKANGKIKHPRRKNRQKAEVYYIVQPKEPYKVRKYQNNVHDSDLKQLVADNFSDLERKVHVNENFDTDKLEAERNRITNLLQNNGYYYFNKEFVYFRIDSSLNNHQVDIKLDIQNYKYKDPINDSVIERPHEKFKIARITVYADYHNKMDTSYAQHTPYRNITIAHNRRLKIKPEVYYYSILMKEGDTYSKKLEEATYKRLNSLGTFKSVNMTFETMPTKGELDVKIFLSPSQAQTFTISTDGNHTNGLFGIEGALAYSHNNTFGGAERLQISLNGGLEMQRLIFASDTSQSIGEEVTGLSNTFNTVEFGPKITLTVPRLVLIQPLLERWKGTYFANPKTEFLAAVNFQNRPDFRRGIEEFNFSYIFHERPEFTLRVTPLELSAIEIEKSDEFQQRIDELNDRFLAASYQNHIIAGGKINFQYNQQLLKRPRRSTYFVQGSFEFAGHTLRGIFNLLNRPFDDPITESYNILGIRFAQFVKLSVDGRHYLKLGRNGKLASRLAAGFGLPGANLREALPFEKSFFIGGTNSVRAWKARTLGPGSYLDPELRFDKIGDIQLEGNLEVRFPLSSWIEGALFTDAGNIWLMNEDSLRVGGVFEANDFVSEIAIGSGFGMRFDLDFFIIRIDLAMPMKNPALPSGERWLFQGGMTDERRNYYRPQINLGIGYPF